LHFGLAVGVFAALPHSGNTGFEAICDAVRSSAGALAGYSFYTEPPAEIRSQACGVVQGYQTYMTAGNSHQRKPFERIEILMDDAKYSRHLRIDGGLLKKGAGGRACFEFYDRKLNPHIQDSIVIKWRE
jgi:hypothetical protein